MVQTGTLTLLMFTFYATKLGGQVNINSKFIGLFLI